MSKVKPIYGVGLDAGSRRTRIVICALEGPRLRFLASGAAPSEGWQKGRIADQGAVAGSMRAALRQAEAAASVSVEGAVVGVGGPVVSGANGHGLVELGHVRAIEQRDVNRVVERAARVILPADRMILQMCPRDFVVDNHPGHRDPRRMLASRLELHVHLVTASAQEHTTLVGAVNQAHLLVEETVFEALAAAYASVLPEDRRQGVAVVDIGSESTEIAVYHGEAMYLASTTKVSGDHFTRDLAHALCVSFEDAERLKLEFGGAVCDACPDNVWIELPPCDHRERGAQRKFVNYVLEERAAQLFRLVQAELRRIGMDGDIMGGVFLAGAGARLEDLCDVAERELRCHARYGLPIGILDWPESLDNPEWTTAAGLAMYSAKLKAQTRRQQAAAGWLGRILK